MTDLEAEAAEVERGLAAVCGELNAAHARLVALVARALRSGCWEGPGILTFEQWVAWQTALSPARARHVVEIARRQADLPVTAAAFAAGELSIDQVAVLARYTPPEVEASVVELARSATVSQLQRTLRSYRFEEAEAPDTAGKPDPCFVSGMFDDEGRYRLRAVLDADDGAVVDAALREAHDALFQAGDLQVSGCDALVEVASRSLAAVPSSSRREAFQALFHVPLDGAPSHLHTGPSLPAALSRQLLCDAQGAVIGLRDGRPVDVGRRCHIVPPALRRVVENRDRGCRVPGCNGSRVQIHHIIHWKDGGPTASFNLTALCPRHHRLHHRGLLGITGNADSPDGLTFADARGRPLVGAPPPLPPPPGAHQEVTGTWTHPTGERLQSKWIHFNRREAAAEPRAG